MKKHRQASSSVFQNAKYFGKHVLIAGDNVYAVKSSKEASRLFEKLVARGVVPTVTFVPKNQSLILAWR